MRREWTCCLCIMLGAVVALASPAFAATLGDGTPLQLKGRYSSAVWSPTGSALALAGEGHKGLYFADTSGTFATISEAPLAGWGFNWSPDGRNLAYRMRAEDGNGVALMMTGQDGKPIQLTPFMDGRLQTAWGKDGLTYKAGDELVTIGEDGSIKKVRSISQGRGLLSRIMTLTSVLMSARITGATLTPLSSLPVANSTKDPKAGDAMFVDSESQIWTVDENGNMKKLLDVPGVQGYATPVASPQGDAYAAHGFDGNLYVADTAGGNPVNLGMGSDPTWSPDGRFIIYTRTRDDGARLVSSELWISSADGTVQYQLNNNNQGVKERPSWSADGKFISYIIDGVVYTAPISM